MMINELPKSTATIATTYFENVDDQSQFKKEMDYNMKLLSGLDPATTNQEIYEMNRQQEDTEIYGGTEQALLNIDDPEVRGFLANRMETFGAAKRSNPDLALQDFYTSTEEANRIVTDDVYRINYTNSKEDPHIYNTKYVIGMQKIYEAMESMKPNYGRLAFRYIGQPALSIGSTYLGGAIGGALTKTPAGVTKGATVGAGVSDSLIAGWDSLALGGTIYNTQEKFVNVWHELLSDKSLTQEQFAQGVDNLVSGILMLDPAYQEEIFSAIVQSPNPFADGGLTFTSFGLKTFAQPLGALARMAKKPIGYFGKGSVFKRMELNEKLVDTIKKEMSNKVDEDIVNENINTKVSQVAPEDVSEKTVETVKGIMKDEETDNKVLKNSNEDYSYSDISVSQEDITTHNASSTVAKMNEEPTTILHEIIPESRRPKQSYFIDHGKGIGDLPMTSEEADKLIKKLQSNAVADYDINYTSKELPDYVAFSSASVKPWGPDDEGVIRPYLSKETARTGAGGMSYHYGVYGSTVAGNELSRKYYLTEVHQKRAENLSDLWSEDEILKKENFKDVENKVDNKKLFERIKRRFVYDLSNLDSLNEYNIKEINIGFDEDYVKDLEKYLAKRNGEDLIYDLESKRESVYQAFQDFYYEGASLEDLKDYAKKIAVLETIQALFRGGNEFPTSWLQTFTGKNPIKYPYKYLYDDVNSEPYVLKVKPEDFKEIPLENQNKYKEVDEKFNKWKQNVKEAVKEKYPEEFGGINSSEIMSRDDWEVVLETYIKDVLNIKEDPESWLRSELNKMGFSAWLHMHHDNAMNIVTINDKDFSEITKLENNPKAVEKYLQIGKNNGFVKVSAGDGVGYFVRELHGVEGSKPMIVENYKVIDKGDYKPYNSKK